MQFTGKRYIVHGSRKDVFTVWDIADIHLWNSGCDVGKVKRDLKKIENDPFAFWVGGGDFCEYIGIHDKRWDPDSLPAHVKARDLGSLGNKQIHEIRDLFYPIRHKCLGLCLGNHEKKYQIMQEQTHLHSWLCTELEVPNLEYSAFFDLGFCRRPRTKEPQLFNSYPGAGGNGTISFRFFIHHGAGGATTPGGKLNRLIQFMDYFEAQIYMINHVHGKSGTRIISIGANADCTKLEKKHKLGVICGGYLDTYTQNATTYGEMKGYRPSILGASKVLIEPDKYKFWSKL